MLSWQPQPDNKYLTFLQIKMRKRRQVLVELINFIFPIFSAKGQHKVFQIALRSMGIPFQWCDGNFG